MPDLTVPATPRSTAFRVFGIMAITIVALITVAVTVRPELVMVAVHAMMGMGG